MPLYSTDSLSNADKGNPDTESNIVGSDNENMPGRKKEISWSYCFVYRGNIDLINERLKEQFKTYIHKSIIYKREKHQIKKIVKASISGLIFIQGKSQEIEKFLNNNLPGIYLCKDCMTKRPAVISDAIMRSFMQIAEINPSRVRFMPHSFDYYSSGHALVKITSGVLTGMEGYQVRIARDKCFITTFGGMTVAIGGVSKETFENVEEYVRQRRENQQVKASESLSDQGISGCFFTPQSQLDLFSIMDALDAWMVKASRLFRDGKFVEAESIAFQILQQTGEHLHRVYGDPSIGDFSLLTDLCADADFLLVEISTHLKSPIELKEKIISERLQLKNSWPFLPIKK